MVHDDGGSLDPADVDLFDPQFYAAGDPHPVWAAMRARHPLHRQTLPDGRTFLSVTRHADACRVLGDHRGFTSERGSLLHQLGRGDAAAGKMLVSTDPPRHTQLRAPLAGALSAKVLASRELEVREAVRRILRPALEAGECDLAAVAGELPMAVAGTLMGIPPPDWPQLSQWTAMAAAPSDLTLCVRNPAATLTIAHHGLFEYFTGQLDGHGDDLIGLLRTAIVGADRLSAEEIVYNCYSILLGANATTPHAAAGTVLAMLDHPAGPVTSLLVEEGLRWTSPANSFLRYARHEVELSGGLVRAGEAVAVWIGAANRDGAVFPEPYRFDAERTHNRHIAFGFGPHYCLGAALARMTLRVFLAELFAAVGRIELVGPVRHLASHFIAGITRLPVRMRQRERVDP
jgi:cytochrome P450